MVVVVAVAAVDVIPVVLHVLLMFLFAAAEFLTGIFRVIFVITIISFCDATALPL